MTQTQNSPNKSTAIDLDFNPMRPVRQVDKLTFFNRRKSLWERKSSSSYQVI